VTLHGLAFNINSNLNHFNNIIPCGIDASDKTVTSLEKELGRKVAMNEVKIKIKSHFALLFVPREDDNGEIDDTMWNVFILNTNESSLTGVLINSRGYGEVDGEDKKTSVLRHYFEEIGPFRATLIEPIQSDVFELANEYWVSYKLD